MRSLRVRSACVCSHRQNDAHAQAEYIISPCGERGDAFIDAGMRQLPVGIFWARQGRVADPSLDLATAIKAAGKADTRHIRQISGR